MYRISIKNNNKKNPKSSTSRKEQWIAGSMREEKFKFSLYPLWYPLIVNHVHIIYSTNNYKPNQIKKKKKKKVEFLSWCRSQTRLGSGMAVAGSLGCQGQLSFDP